MQRHAVGGDQGVEVFCKSLFVGLRQKAATPADRAGVPSFNAVTKVWRHGNTARSGGRCGKRPPFVWIELADPALWSPQKEAFSNLDERSGIRWPGGRMRSMHDCIGLVQG